MDEQLFVPKSQDFSEPLLLPTAAQKFQARNQSFFGAAGRAPMTNESLETLKQATTTTPTAANSVELNGVHALLHEKVRGLKYGEVCVYHSGSLAADRLNSEQLNTLATSLSFMAQRKRIQLCQRRLAENYYDYLAIGCE